MKYLPCHTCHETALATKGGILHSAGRLSGPHITYICKRCGHTTRLTALEFSLQPEMTASEIEAPTCDIDAKSCDLTGRKL